MLIECGGKEFVDYIVDDPVRPNLFEDNFVRFSGNFRVYADVDVVKNKVLVNAMVCVAICPFIPQSEEQLQDYALGYMDKLLEDVKEIEKAHYGVTNINTIICPYSLWSYKKGAGRKLINELIEAIPILYPSVQKVITMSPPTKVAENFHLSNGARLLAANRTTINYEYSLPKSKIVIH